MNLKKVYSHVLLAVLLLSFSACGGGSSSNTSAKQGETTYTVTNLPELISKDKMKSSTKTPIKKMNQESLEKTEYTNSEVMEDASMPKWVIYDKSPDGAIIENIYDNEKGSNVIKFTGTELQNGFVIGYWTNQDWNDKEHNAIQWDMNFNEDYMLYVRVDTKEGYRYLYYTPSDYNYGVSSYDEPHYIHHGLGSDSNDGTWKKVTRDLNADLQEFEPNNEVRAIRGFFVRGSGMVDDITLLKSPKEESSSCNNVDNIESIYINNKKTYISILKRMEVTSSKYAYLRVRATNYYNPRTGAPIYMEDELTKHIIRVDCNDHSKGDELFVEEYNSWLNGYIGDIDNVSYYAQYYDSGQYSAIVGLGDSLSTHTSFRLKFYLSFPTFSIVDKHIVVTGNHVVNTYDVNGTLLSHISF